MIDDTPKDVQEKSVVRSELSKDLDLPLVHTRDALEDTYAIIKSEGVVPRGGIMHSFSGSLEEAETLYGSGNADFFWSGDVKKAKMSKKSQSRSIKSC